MRKLTPLLFIALAMTVRAGDAVSSLNGKLGFNYGDYDSDDGRTLSGSVALPLSTHYGTQLDGLYTHVGGVEFYGAGAHLFWRDSSRGLIGLAATGVDSENVKTYEGGVEAEYYFPWLTPGIYTGYSTIRYSTPAPFIDTDATKPFVTVYLGIYPLPDLLIRPSVTRKLNNTQCGVEVEYTLRSSNLALTAEMVRGQHDFRQTDVGLRYYFGGKKSLKARHREDDPVSLVSGALTSIGAYGAEYNQKGNAYVRAHSSGGSGGGGGDYGTYGSNITTTNYGGVGGSGVILTGGTLSLGGSINSSAIVSGLTQSGSGTVNLSSSTLTFSGTFNLSSGAATFSDSNLVITNGAQLWINPSSGLSLTN